MARRNSETVHQRVHATVHERQLTFRCISRTHGCVQHESRVEMRACPRESRSDDDGSFKLCRVPKSTSFRMRPANLRGSRVLRDYPEQHEYVHRLPRVKLANLLHFRLIPTHGRANGDLGDVGRTNSGTIDRFCYIQMCIRWTDYENESDRMDIEQRHR